MFDPDLEDPESLGDTASILRGEAMAAGRTADAMLRLAAMLEHDLDTLRPVLDGVRRLHTESTWQGDAAIRSRGRLDRATRTSTTVLRTVSELSIELRSRAVMHQHHADDAWHALSILHATHLGGRAHPIGP